MIDKGTDLKFKQLVEQLDTFLKYNGLIGTSNSDNIKSSSRNAVTRFKIILSRINILESSLHACRHSCKYATNSNYDSDEFKISTNNGDTRCPLMNASEYANIVEVLIQQQTAELDNLYGQLICAAGFLSDQE